MNLDEKRIVLLGSTGSIGKQALDVAENLNIRVKGITANTNVELIEKQIRKYKPSKAAMMDEKAASELRSRTADLNVKICSGLDGVCEVASMDDCDIVLNSIVGLAGLIPTLTAIENKKDIALANKETLVAGGELVKEAALRNNVAILPVDSEHSAIFQCLQGCSNTRSDIKRVILTASGGPFFGNTRNDLLSITKKEALNHPNWSMGAKITIDSATLMNKGLEFIEAIWLFNLKPEQISVIIHRESIIHSMVEYIDNSVIAQMGFPDMRIPIQYALTFPERTTSAARQLNLIDCGKLTFFEPDEETFNALRICKDAIKIGGTMPSAVNGANEEAVSLFLNDKISFLDISDLVEEVLKNHNIISNPTLDDILEADKSSRAYVRNLINMR